jgi:hypothetical protein
MTEDDTLSSFVTETNRNKNIHSHHLSSNENDSSSSSINTTKSNVVVYYSMDQAYRRLGHKLSQRVTDASQNYPPPPSASSRKQRTLLQQPTMGCPESSAFSKVVGLWTNRTGASSRYPQEVSFLSFKIYTINLI